MNEGEGKRTRNQKRLKGQEPNGRLKGHRLKNPYLLRLLESRSRRTKDSELKISNVISVDFKKGKKILDENKGGNNKLQFISPFQPNPSPIVAPVESSNENLHDIIEIIHNSLSNRIMNSNYEKAFYRFGIKIGDKTLFYLILKEEEWVTFYENNENELDEMVKTLRGEGYEFVDLFPNSSGDSNELSEEEEEGQQFLVYYYQDSEDEEFSVNDDGS